MSSTEEYRLIQDCIAHKREAEYRLYQFFAPRLFPVCRRYSRNAADAEDILQEGFIKAFRYLSDFSNSGSFEGWLRRIMITTALNFYKRKRSTYLESELNYMPDVAIPERTVTASLLQQDLMNIVNELPSGYKQVFSLNSIEGYTHKEIGDMLNISVNTSKSQLTRARYSLQKKYHALMMEKSTQISILQIA